MHSTRDPFNLRNKAALATPSAFAILQNAATKTTEKALASTKQAVEATKQAIHDTDMSFASVPSLETAHRRFEDNVWSKVTGKENGLPMYKDKPTGYGYGVGSARGRRPFLKTRKGVGLLALVVLGVLYWFGWSSTAQDGSASNDGKTKWVPFSGGGRGKKGNAVWDKRRNSVRDAFLLSWNAYEEHGWGTSSRGGDNARDLDSNRSRLRRIPPRLP